MPGLKDLSYEQRLRKLKLPTLVHRRMRGDMIQTYKIIKGIDKIDINKMFELVDGSKTRGHSLKIRKKHSRLDLRKYFFSNRIIDLWNALPQHVVEAKDTNAFKNSLDRCWTNQPTYYDYLAEPITDGTLKKLPTAKKSEHNRPSWPPSAQKRSM